MKQTVRDVMSTNVVVAREETPFKELVRLMALNRISGIPVVAGEEPRLVGIVSEADLLTVEAQEKPPRSLLLQWFIDRRRLEEIARIGDDIRAENVMTRNVVTARPETPVVEAARTMIDRGVKRLPVVNAGGELVGIVSRRDLLQPYLRSDEEVHREIIDQVILRTMWIDPSTLEVDVKRGVVALKGEVELRSTRDILVELVRRVDGVVGVKDQLTFREDDREGGAPPLRRGDPGLVDEQR